MKYTFFWHSTSPFSNWYPAEFTYKGNHFKNSEQAFMWEKALMFNDLITANEILKISDPKSVKALGREVKNFDEKIWEKYRKTVMYEVCYAKFSQHPELKEQLLSHSNYVEASPYDLIWGIGLAEEDPLIKNPENWRGLNLLGVVLNQLKKELEK